MPIALSLSKATLVSALGTSCSYALIVMLANSTEATSFGEYLLCLAWAAILTILIDCASDAAFSHFAIQNGDTQDAFNTIITIRLIVFLFVVGIFGACKVAGLIDVSWKVIIFLFAAFNLGPLYEFYRANVEFSVVIFVEKAALLILAYALLLRLGFQGAIYLSYAIVTFLSLLFQGYRHRHHVLAYRTPSASAVYGYVKIYWPMVLISLAQIGYGHISRLIIEEKKGIIVFASISLAFQVIALASIIQTQVDRIFRPMIIETIKSGNETQIKKLLLKYLFLATFPMLCCAFVIFFIAPWLVDFLFGPQYQSAARALQIISPMFFSISLMRLADLMLLALNKVRLNMATNLGSSLLMFIIMQCVPTTQPLAYLLLVVVGCQFTQAAIAGIFSIHALRRRSR